MVDTVIRVGIAYSFYVVPFSMPDILKLDWKLIALQKAICGLPRSIPNITTQLPHELFGSNVFSLKTAYLTCIGEQLRNALNDPGRLGKIYQGLTNHIFAKHGGTKLLNTHILVITTPLVTPISAQITLLDQPYSPHQLSNWYLSDTPTILWLYHGNTWAPVITPISPADHAPCVTD
jgi:hypothetical protein